MYFDEYYTDLCAEFLDAKSVVYRNNEHEGNLWFQFAPKGIEIEFDEGTSDVWSVQAHFTKENALELIELLQQYIKRLDESE